MPIDYSEAGDFEKWPKVGEEKIFFIKNSEKVNNPNDKFNFKRREKRKLEDGFEAEVEVNLGYNYKITLSDGKTLSLNNWSVYYAMGAANVRDGDKILVKHPEKGMWKIEVLNQGNQDYDKSKEDKTDAQREAEKVWNES